MTWGVATWKLCVGIGIRSTGPGPFVGVLVVRALFAWTCVKGQTGRLIPPLHGDMTCAHELQSGLLTGGYIGDHIGDYYRGY